MPFAPANGINLYYQVHGEGPNLTLIEGAGYHSWMWYRQIDAFSQHFRTLIYDNRGVGQSDASLGPYTHAQNAADLVALLDLLGWERTHLLGVSMGGFIAQEFALAYPQRVDRLVLVATAFGGPNMAPLPPEAVESLLPRPDLGPEQQIRTAMLIAFADPTWPERNPAEMDWIVAQRLAHLQSDEARMAQLMANVAFDVEDRLDEITAPTLIVIGAEDRVVPPENGRLLAERLPNAHLDVIPGAGHLALIEQADRFNGDVISFLQEPA